MFVFVVQPTNSIIIISLFVVTARFQNTHMSSRKIDSIDSLTLIQLCIQRNKITRNSQKLETTVVSTVQLYYTNKVQDNAAGFSLDLRTK